MADQAQATLPAGTGKTPEPGKSDGNTRGFPPKGQPLITGINRIGLWSLYIKEVRRFLKVQTQTIWAPAVTTLLFLVIFTVAMGRGGPIGHPSVEDLFDDFANGRYRLRRSLTH